MSKTEKKPMPNAVRPTGRALYEKNYWVRDRIDEKHPNLRVWGQNLTYDDAWKLKESVVGSRQSTTARVESMYDWKTSVTAQVEHDPATAGWTDDQRKFAAEKAAKAAQQAASQAAARAAAAAASARVTVDEAEMLAESGLDDDQLDALIDEANASEH